MEKKIAIIKTFSDGTIDKANETQCIQIDEIESRDINV